MTNHNEPSEDVLENFRQQLSPLSHCVIALSTAYHEYNPLFIKTFHSLILLNGVDCIVTPRKNQKRFCSNQLQQEQEQRHGTTESSMQCQHNGYFDDEHVLPISKCKIVGVIVYCSYKSNGSIILIVDDGTGHCDCIGWTHDYDDHEIDHRYRVGDSIQVQGAIKILSLKENRIVRVGDATHEIYEGWTCIRELHIHSMHRVASYDEETLHWLTCLQFQKRIGMHTSGLVLAAVEANTGALQEEEVPKDVQDQIMNTPILNGLETFQLLSQDEQLHIYSMRGSEDSVRMLRNDILYERVFRQYYGRNCTCDLKYKDILLYCHCLARKEPLDPKFQFRDALLDRLVDMENCIVEETMQAMDGGGASYNELQRKRLEFEYSALLQDGQLCELAKEIVAETTDPNINLRRLYTNTFKHLRDDGVVYLLNENTDTYLFMSKDRVLLPEVLKLEIENDQWDFQRKTLGETSITSIPPQLPEFLQRSLSFSKLKLLQKLARRARISGVDC